MKNALLLITLIGLNSFYSSAQLSNSSDRYASQTSVTSNIDRYKIDYELVDETILDSNKSILLSLNLNLIEDKRTEESDQIFIDPTTQISIVVYSYTKVAQRKEGTSNSLNQNK